MEGSRTALNRRIRPVVFRSRLPFGGQKGDCARPIFYRACVGRRRNCCRPNVSSLPAHPRACGSPAVDRPIGPSLPSSLKWVELPGQDGDTLARCALAPTVAGREGSTTSAKEADLAECPASVTNTHATQFRPPCPIQFSPDMKRTHSQCYIPTAKSGGAPHRPPPQSPSPK